MPEGVEALVKNIERTVPETYQNSRGRPWYRKVMALPWTRPPNYSGDVISVLVPDGLEALEKGFSPDSWLVEKT